MKEIQLGDRIKDDISGFEGIATGMTEYINGCRQWLIHPEKLDKDGKAIDGIWIDEQRLKIVKKQVLPEPPAFAAQLMEQRSLTGGPDAHEPPQTRRHT